MATRSTIAMEQPDGRIMQIYCHWDGYLDNNGQLLQDHYRDNAKILALMLLGGVSSLRSEIGQPHDFDSQYDDQDPRSNWTKAYGRDRGESGMEARVFPSFKDYKSQAQFEEYNYIFRGTEWFVQYYKTKDFVPLGEALLKHAAEAELAEDE